MGHTELPKTGLSEVLGARCSVLARPNHVHLGRLVWFMQWVFCVVYSTHRVEIGKHSNGHDGDGVDHADEDDHDGADDRVSAPHLRVLFEVLPELRGVSGTQRVRFAHSPHHIHSRRCGSSEPSRGSAMSIAFLSGFDATYPLHPRPALAASFPLRALVAYLMRPDRRLPSDEGYKVMSRPLYRISARPRGSE
jgi:hypothetical protein